MGFFTLNQLYTLKKIDIFSKPVELRLQRSKEGGASDTKVGSWFGVFLTFGIIATLASMISSKIGLMNEYQNVSYESVLMKNVFHDEDSNTISELRIGNFSYLPSLEFKLIGDSDEIESIKNDKWTEVINFDESDIRLPSINIDFLKKYLKFHVKYYH